MMNCFIWQNVNGTDVAIIVIAPSLERARELIKEAGIMLLSPRQQIPDQVSTVRDPAAEEAIFFGRSR